MQVADGITQQRTVPTDAAASAEELRTLLRLDTQDEDAYLETLLKVATESAGRYLSRSLLTTEWTRQYDSLIETKQLRPEYRRSVPVMLTYPPVRSVDRVYIINHDGDETTLTGWYEDLASAPARVYITEILTGREIAMLRVDYTAGYTTVPVTIQQGILQHAAYMYEHRGDCSADEARRLSGAQELYRSYRVALQ
jgi:uncharacterized phiE125 gp8 family phage protein